MTTNAYPVVQVRWPHVRLVAIGAVLAGLTAAGPALHFAYGGWALMLVFQVGEEKRCLLWLIGGSRVKEWAADFLAVCEAWARDTMGCAALWGAGRAGWVRIVKKFGGLDIGVVDGQPAWQRRIA